MNLKLKEIEIFNNERLSKLFSSLGINRINLISVGNSIASGFGIVDITKPLLYRNESLTTIMADNGVDLSCFHYARAINNNDELIHSWFLSNVKLSEIFKMNRYDYATRINGKAAMGMKYPLSEEEKDKYFPISPKQDNGLSDLLLAGDNHSTNIIIYNGCTGSFLDNWDRGGIHKFTYPIKKDGISLQATLKFIQEMNRSSNTNNQVYLCGVPKPIIDTPVMNRMIRNISKLYPNTTYVNPALMNISIKGIDFHYSQEQYQVLNNNITATIYQNFIFKQALIDIDRELLNLSLEMEISPDRGINSSDYIMSRLNNIIDKWIEIINSYNLDVSIFINTLYNYIREQFPHYYFHIGKININKKIRSLSK